LQFENLAALKSKETTNLKRKQNKSKVNEKEKTDCKIHFTSANSLSRAWFFFLFRGDCFVKRDEQDVQQRSEGKGKGGEERQTMVNDNDLVHQETLIWHKGQPLHHRSLLRARERVPFLPL
jgi:hypothetical protein